MEKLNIVSYNDTGTFPIINNKNGDTMTIYEVTKDDLTELKKDIMDNFNSVKLQLEGMKGQYTDLMVRNVEMKKDIQSIENKLAYYDNMIKAILGTILTVIITAILALVIKN